MRRNILKTEACLAVWFFCTLTSLSKRLAKNNNHQHMKHILTLIALAVSFTFGACCTKPANKCATQGGKDACCKAKAPAKAPAKKMAAKKAPAKADAKAPAKAAAPAAEKAAAPAAEKAPEAK